MARKPRTFRPAHMPSVEQSKRDYERRRGSARQRGYTVAWDRASLAFKHDNPLCLGCRAVGVLRATEVVDHVEPHRGDLVLFWQRDMWQPACAWHHDVVKARLEVLFDKGEIGVDELWLDSPTACSLTRLLTPTPT